MAYDAVSPPVVGSVITEMYGRPAFASRARAAEIFAICISERIPSCMRAPPEHDTMITGSFLSVARSIACVIFSPTTEPIDPPMKLYSIAQITTLIPSSFPSAHKTASPRPTRCS